MLRGYPRSAGGNPRAGGLLRESGDSQLALSWSDASSWM